MRHQGLANGCSRCLLSVVVAMAMATAIVAPSQAEAAKACPSQDIVFLRHGRLCYEPPLKLAAKSADAIERSVRPSLPKWLPCEASLRWFLASYSAEESKDKSLRFSSTVDAVHSAIAEYRESSACKEGGESSAATWRFADTSHPTAEEITAAMAALEAGEGVAVVVASKEILIQLGAELEQETACPALDELARLWRENRESSDYFYENFWALVGGKLEVFPVDYSGFDDCNALEASGELSVCGKPKVCASIAPSQN